MGSWVVNVSRKGGVVCDLPGEQRLKASEEGWEKESNHCSTVIT